MYNLNTMKPFKTIADEKIYRGKVYLYNQDTVHDKANCSTPTRISLEDAIKKFGEYPAQIVEIEKDYGDNVIVTLQHYQIWLPKEVYKSEKGDSLF